jgi:hypothetical protein
MVANKVDNGRERSELTWQPWREGATLGRRARWRERAGTRGKERLQEGDCERNRSSCTAEGRGLRAGLRAEEDSDSDGREIFTICFIFIDAKQFTKCWSCSNSSEIYARQSSCSWR